MTTTRPAPAPSTLTRTRRFAGRHPLLTLMLLFNTFGQALVIVPTLVWRDRAPALEVLQCLSLVLFLFLPALVLVRLSRGSEELRVLLRRMVSFRVPVRWYAVPLLVVPTGVFLVNSSLPHDQPIDVQRVAVAYLTGFLPALLVQFVTTNWWEETVWTGVVQEPLQARLGPVLGVLATTPLFALEHAFLTLGSTVGEALVLMAVLTVALVFVRCAFGWVFRRTGSLALVGLVHGASNAAALGLVSRLFPGSTPDGILVLVVLGLLALVATRGRLGWPRDVRHLTDGYVRRVRQG